MARYNIDVCEVWLDPVTKLPGGERRVDKLTTDDIGEAIRWAVQEARELPDHLVRVIDTATTAYVYIHVPFAQSCPFCLGTDAVVTRHVAGILGAKEGEGTHWCWRCERWMTEDDLIDPCHENGGY